MKQIDAGEPAAPAPADRTGWYGWYVTVVLMLCATLSYVDNSLPSILVQAIKADLRLSDSQIGLITGPAFSLTFAICAIPISKLSDRHARTWVIGTAIAVWSLLTATGGIARGFLSFGLSRAGVAIGESALTPAANSIVTDVTTPKARPIAISIYQLGAPIGTAASLAVGGLIADRYGWRTTCFLVGAAGFVLLALLILTVREPVRRRGPAGRPLSTGNLRSFFANPALRNIVFGATLVGFSASAFAGWGPAYVMRTFRLSAAQAGASFGGMVGLVGVAGMLLGGFTASWFAISRPGRVFRLISMLLVAAAVAQFAALLCADYGPFLALMAVCSLCLSFYVAPTMSAVQSLVDPGARSFAAAVTLFCIMGIGLAFGIFTVGVLSDLLRPRFGDGSLRWALLIPMSARLWAAGHYLVVARTMERIA